MPVTDSRLGPGTLMLGTAQFETQVAACRITPTVDSTDGTPTLAVPEPAPESSISWALNIDAIQDFEDAAGLVNYLMDNALSEVPFEWVPNTAYGATTPLSFSGTVQIVPIEIGGDVAVQVVTSVELPIVGTPVRVDAAPLGRGSKKEREAA
jgi:hypothetical protein